MPDTDLPPPAGPTTDDVAQQATDAAMAVFERHLKLYAPPLHVVEEALAAAAEVYDQAEAAAVDQIMAQVGLAGMDVVGDTVRIHIKHAAVVAAGMVKAFDELVQQRGCVNYLETQFTVTDPALEQAIADGVPQDQWPPHRRYTFIVVKPGGRTPHQLREDAEKERDDLADRLRVAHEKLAVDELDQDSCTTLETTVDEMVRAYLAVTDAEEKAADENRRLRTELHAILRAATPLAEPDPAGASDALHAIACRARQALNTAVSR